MVSLQSDSIDIEFPSQHFDFPFCGTVPDMPTAGMGKCDYRD
jgi:hypothetical protein